MRDRQVDGEGEEGRARGESGDRGEKSGPAGEANRSADGVDWWDAGRDGQIRVTQEIAAEAAVWIARLHGPNRSPRMEAQCQAWLARSAGHRLAFERGTDIWMDVGGITLASYARAAGTRDSQQRAPRARSPVRPRAVALSAALAVALASALVLYLWRSDERYETGVGEQRIVMLPDGSRMSLNTATRVRVDFEGKQRVVDVEGGEALFEVAKEKSRPFIVRAAGSEVQATGTAFVVRYVPATGGPRAALDVTLVEGRVVVRGRGDVSSAAEAAPPVEMVAGQRLRVGRRVGGVPAIGAPSLDRPRMDQILAWKRGEAVFDDVSLSDALAEMNRYSATPLGVATADAAALEGLRVSGVFHTGDNAAFARAVAKLHGLTVRERAGGLELALP